MITELIVSSTEEQVKLHWNFHSKESGKIYFAIERSLDNIIYETVGEVLKNPIKDIFNFYDLKPLNSTLYYRISVYRKVYNKERFKIFEKNTSILFYSEKAEANGVLV